MVLPVMTLASRKSAPLPKRAITLFTAGLVIPEKFEITVKRHISGVNQRARCVPVEIGSHTATLMDQPQS